jgi:hypothetical protein
MKAILNAVTLGAIVCATALAQSNKDALPLGTTQFVCKWGDDVTDEKVHGIRFTIQGGSLVTAQGEITGAIWHVLENNKYGIVATQSESEYVPQLKKTIVAFFSIAIDRATGNAVESDGRTDIRGIHSGNTTMQGICTAAVVYQSQP